MRVSDDCGVVPKKGRGKKGERACFRAREYPEHALGPADGSNARVNPVVRARGCVLAAIHLQKLHLRLRVVRFTCTASVAWSDHDKMTGEPCLGWFR